jgi:hypothetical protein
MRGIPSKRAKRSRPVAVFRARVREGERRKHSAETQGELGYAGMRLPTPTSARMAESDDRFVVDLAKFQGPLDLLLHLIRAQDIDIFDIPIADVTAQFIAAIEGVEERLSLERAGEFLEMAATLVRIKAQMLLTRIRVPSWYGAYSSMSCFGKLPSRCQPPRPTARSTMVRDT